MSTFPKRSDPLVDRSIVQATICYDPTRTAYGPDLIPCNAALVIASEGKQASMCCSMGGGASSANDTCHPTGLCLNDNAYYRDYCTDPTFQSPNCLNICTDPKNHGSSTNSLVNSCGSDTWCCGENLKGVNCCNNASAVFSLAPTLVAYATGATVTSTVTAISSSSHSQNLKGATIGLGAVLGVGMIASVAGFFVLKRKWNRRDVPRYNEVEYGSAEPPMAPMESGGQYYEAPTNPALPAELSSARPGPTSHDHAGIPGAQKHRLLP